MIEFFLLLGGVTDGAVRATGGGGVGGGVRGGEDGEAGATVGMEVEEGGGETDRDGRCPRLSFKNVISFIFFFLFRF